MRAGLPQREPEILARWQQIRLYEELRKRAQTELRQKFDQRQFHDTVLKNGALPLEILEEQVTAYIQAAKQ